MSAGVVYTVISKIFPPQTAMEFKTLGFEELSPEKRRGAQRESTAMGDAESVSEMGMDAKGEDKTNGVESRVYPVQ